MTTPPHQPFLSIKAAAIFRASAVWLPLAMAGSGPSAHAQQTSGTAAAEFAEAVAVSGSAVYAAGATSGSLEGKNLGGQDAFLRKYDGDGKVLWARQFGTSANDVANGVAADGSGDVYVAGYTSGALAGSSGGIDAFLIKYTGHGHHAWTRQFGTPAEDVATALSVDGSGNIYVVGYTFGRLQGQDQRGSDAFVRKYTPNGAVIWTKQFGTSGSDHAQAVAADAAGNAYVVGYVNGALEGSWQGSADAYIRKYDAAGTVQWTRQFGTGGYDAAFDVALDGTGAAIVAGWTTGSFGGFTNAGGKDAFMVKYSASGKLQRTSQFGTRADDIAIGVATDPANNFYVTGRTKGSLDGANAGDFDVFVRKYTSDSSSPEGWLIQFGTSEYDATYAIAAASANRIYLAGETAGALGGANQGTTDAFVRRIDKSGTAVWTDQ